MGVANIIVFVIAAVLAVEWVIAYHRKTGGRWRSGPMGRHLMVFMSAIAVVLSLGATRAIVVVGLEYDDPSWFQAVRLIALASIPAVIVWRRILLARAQSDMSPSQR